MTKFPQINKNKPKEPKKDKKSLPLTSIVQIKIAIYRK